MNELRFDGAHPQGTYGKATIDGTEYFVMVPELEITGTPFGAEIRSRFMFDVVNKCDCCGRFDSHPTVLSSFSEAIARGWFVLTSEFAK